MRHLCKKHLIGLALCALAVPLQAEDRPKQTCVSEAVTISSDFAGGRLNGCRFSAANHVQLTITPEDEPPINPSPWYAFQVAPKTQSPLEVNLAYKHAKHRYWPKISQNGKNWYPLNQKYVKRLNDHLLRLTLPAMDTPYFIAGQEIITTQHHETWADTLATRQVVHKSRIGQSLEGRAIYKYESKPSGGGTDYIFLVGRQHPPEVTGALALMPFVETLYANTPLATRFREHFGIITVPILNPDGVAAGHWRHNRGSTDLNRDWGPFRQPETQLMQQELERFNITDRLNLFLDFHSTRRNVLYTQAEDEATTPNGFTRNWVKAVQARVENYTFERAERPLSDLPTSKNYVYRTFGIPAITYEVGDETDRQALSDAAKIFAEEMMRTLLESKGL